MDNNVCYLCKNENIDVLHKGTRDNADIDVLKCQNCGLVFLSTFSHVNDELYEDSKMNSNDINIIQWREETKKDDERRLTTLKEVIYNKKILDFGCGNGGFLKLSSDIASIAVGVELDRMPRNYLIHEGYKVLKNIDEINNKFDIITLFHVLEHLKDPVSYLNIFKNKLNNGGQIIIEIPNADDALLSLYHSKAFANFTYWSLHLFLYNVTTLEKLAEMAGLKINWIKQVQRYCLANHLYWLSEGKPGGGMGNRLSCLNNIELDRKYIEQLESNSACDTIMMSLKI